MRLARVLELLLLLGDTAVDILARLHQFDGCTLHLGLLCLECRLGILKCLLQKVCIFVTGACV